MNGTSTGSLPSKPVPPPRDHLRIEKDGRLVNKAPAPQVPARGPATTLLNNNHQLQTDNFSNQQSVNNNVQPAAVNSDIKEVPTNAELSSIRKYTVSISFLSSI